MFNDMYDSYKSLLKSFKKQSKSILNAANSNEEISSENNHEDD